VASRHVVPEQNATPDRSEATLVFLLFPRDDELVKSRNSDGKVKSFKFKARESRVITARKRRHLREAYLAYAAIIYPVK